MAWPEGDRMTKADYVMRTIVLNKNNVTSFFTRMKNRRGIRTSKVTQLITKICRGEHFHAIFVVNKKSDKNRLIDGNHRLDAIQGAIKRDPNLKIEVRYAEYKNKTNDEEREIFQVWNIGSAQTADDFLKVWFDTIPFGDEMLRKIPASIYSNKKKVKLKVIAGAHMVAKNGKPFGGGYAGSREDIVRDLKLFEQDDINKMRAFMKEMSLAFGTYDSGNEFYKTTSLYALYKLWYDNLDIRPDIFMKAITKVLLNPQNILRWREYAKGQGRASERLFYNDLLRELKHLEDTKGYTGIVFNGQAV